jgi:hypothetical protein
MIVEYLYSLVANCIYITNAYLFVLNLELKRPLERPRRRWEDTVKVHCKEHAIYCEDHTEHTNIQIYNDLIRTSQETHYDSATETNRLMLKERVAVNCKYHTEIIRPMRGENA